MAAEQCCAQVVRHVSLKCQEHSKDLIPLYCKDCELPLCTKCVTGHHKSHHIVDVENISGAFRLTLTRLLQNRTKVLDHVNGLIARTDEILNKCTSHTQNVMKEISEKGDKIIQQTKERKSCLLKKAKALSGKCQKELLDTKTKHEEMLQDLDLLHDDNSCQALNDLEVVHVNHRLEKIMKMKVDHLPHQSGFPFSFSSADYNLDVIESKSAPVFKTYYFKVGQGGLHDILPITEYKAYLVSGCTLYKVDLQNRKPERPVMVMMGVKEISLTAEGTVLALQSEKPTVVRHILKDDRNIVFCSSTMDAVAACRSAYCFAIIAFRGARGNLIIAGCNNMGIVTSKVDTGNIGLNLNKRIHLCYTRGMKMVVLNNNVLQVHDQDSFLEDSFSGITGPSPKDTFMASGFCIDHKDRIVVAGTSDNAVHLLDKDAKFVRFLLSEIHGIVTPYSVAMDTNNRLWVGCTDGKIMIVPYDTLFT